MALFRIASDRFESIPRTTYAAENIFERKDIQRLLRADLSPLGDDLLLIAEEFGEWEDSSRRIDLLCLNQDGHLVVIEIKRSEDGGHMELQAIRYAAMIARMSADQLVDAYERTHAVEHDAALAAIADFLQVDSAEEIQIAEGVRIILVSADFSAELATTVIWLNNHDLDIRCYRLQPHRLGNEILVDVSQIIPLPEATDYVISLREQQKDRRKAEGYRQQLLRRFWSQLIERSKARTSLLANRSPASGHWINAGIGRSGFWMTLALTRDEAMANCFFRLAGGEEKNMAAFRALKAQSEQIEQRFGGTLIWDEREGRLGCEIRVQFPGGWQTPEGEWPAMQDRMIEALIRLEAALKRPILELRI